MLQGQLREGTQLVRGDNGGKPGGGQLKEGATLTRGEQMLGLIEGSPKEEAAVDASRAAGDGRHMPGAAYISCLPDRPQGSLPFL